VLIGWVERDLLKYKEFLEEFLKIFLGDVWINVAQ
jgi:hypothetical protein